MRLASIEQAGEERAALVVPAGAVPLAAVNDRHGTDWPTDLLSLLTAQRLEPLAEWCAARDDLAELAVPAAEVRYAPPYRRPRKIWGIGLNYVDHAADLDENAPKGEPASFLKPDTTIIGPGEEILLPRQSQRVTAESELGVVIGREARDVSEADALSYVAGFTTIIDMTAEDILRRNPRYLTRSKSFDTFFSFGPELVTVDELIDAPEQLAEVEVETWRNGELFRKNVVGNMTFSPEFLVSFHSAVMTLLPGDIISTGTPGAAPIEDGDTVGCRITRLTELTNPVVRPSE